MAKNNTKSGCVSIPNYEESPANTTVKAVFNIVGFINSKLTPFQSLRFHRGAARQNGRRLPCGADAEIQEKKRDPTTLPQQSQILLTRGSVREEDPRFLKGETAESETLSIAFRCSRRMWRSE